MVPLPRDGFVAAHDPTHLPVMSTVGATVGGPTPPAHPPTASIASTIRAPQRIVMVSLPFFAVDWSLPDHPDFYHRSVITSVGEVPDAGTVVGSGDPADWDSEVGGSCSIRWMKHR